MIDQLHITGRIIAEDDGYYLFIRDEFIRSYKTYPAAKGQLSKRLTNLYNDELKRQFLLEVANNG